LKKYSLIPALCIFTFLATAQVDSVYTGSKPIKKPKEKKDDAPWREKVFYGGNFNAMFGTFTILNLNPIIGYRVTEKFHVGGGGVFNYYSVRYGSQRISQTFYGSHTFARLFLFPNIFVQTQYDRLYQPKINFTQGTLEKGWIDYLLVGGGARQSIGEKTFFITSILYNIISDPRQIPAYSNPVIQIGIITGF
jgi:hypothetical protein